MEMNERYRIPRPEDVPTRPARPEATEEDLAQLRQLVRGAEIACGLRSGIARVLRECLETKNPYRAKCYLAKVDPTTVQLIKERREPQNMRNLRAMYANACDLYGEHSRVATVLGECLATRNTARADAYIERMDQEAQDELWYGRDGI